MKIALLSEKYTPDIGGLAISAGRLGHLLASAGHEVRVFAPTLGLPASEKRTLPHNGVSVTRFGARKRVDDTLVDWLELILEEHKRAPFDVLNAYFLPQAGFVATYAGKYLGIPSVVSIRGNDIERAAFDPSKFSHVMYALQNADAVTTNASELMKKAKAFVDREIFLIPNGINTNHFEPLQKNAALAESLGLGDLPVIGFSGELREKKGLRALLYGYAKLNVVRPTALLIVGDVRAGEDKQAFDELRASIPNSQIVITGFVSHKDIPSFYSLMDVFVHPSLRDGMPNALLEAMACEKSVIATPVGGIMDIVENEKNGMLIHINDENALTDKVCELLDDHEKRQRLGKAARETIEGRFTLANELKANLDVYRSLGLKV